jgi:hypothetical protein
MENRGLLKSTVGKLSYSVSTVSDRTTGRQRFDPRQRKRIFFVLASVSRPALRTIQPPMGTGVSFSGGKERPGRDADHSLHLVPGQEWIGAILPLPLVPCMAVTGHLYFLLQSSARHKPLLVIFSYYHHLLHVQLGDQELATARNAWRNS